MLLPQKQTKKWGDGDLWEDGGIEKSIKGPTGSQNPYTKPNKRGRECASRRYGRDCAPGRVKAGDMGVSVF